MLSIYLYSYACLHTYMFIHMHACIYTYIYMYMYIYTNIHICAQIIHKVSQHLMSICWLPGTIWCIKDHDRKQGRSPLLLSSPFKGAR